MTAAEQTTYRQRQRARGGRHFMNEARKASAQLAADIVNDIATGGGITHHELSSPLHSFDYLVAMFKAGQKKRLKVRLEGDENGATFTCLATDVAFASLKLAAYEEAGE